MIEPPIEKGKVVWWEDPDSRAASKDVHFIEDINGEECRVECILDEVSFEVHYSELYGSEIEAIAELLVNDGTSAGRLVGNHILEQFADDGSVLPDMIQSEMHEVMNRVVSALWALNDPGFSFDVYQSGEDNEWVVHIDTHGIPENMRGPCFRAYINNDTDSPIWDNPNTVEASIEYAAEKMDGEQLHAVLDGDREPDGQGEGVDD